MVYYRVKIDTPRVLAGRIGFLVLPGTARQGKCEPYPFLSFVLAQTYGILIQLVMFKISRFLRFRI